MTVGIAALCDSGMGCVLAADQMIAAEQSLGYEFETEDVGKIVPLVDSIYALVAGNILFANEIIEAARLQIKTPRDVKQVAEVVRKTYQDVRRQQVVRSELEPRGLDLNSFYQIQQRLLPNIVQAVDQAFKQHNLGVELLIAGQDELGSHIFTVQHPGEIVYYNPLGFAAIGPGGPHAIYYLLESKYSKSLKNEEVEELLRKAKLRAELSPRVGKGVQLVSVKKRASEVLH
jgi:20S proteasome alpha/beta subunit